MLESLVQKVDPKHAALIVVDVLNDFCAPGGAMDRDGRDMSMVKVMLPRLEGLIAAARAASVKVIWVRCAYDTEPNHYLSEVWLEQEKRKRSAAYFEKPFCEPNTWSSQFSTVEPADHEAVVTKHRYGAFEGTNLDLILRSGGIRSVIITGVATNVCCETTARQAFMKDYYVVFPRDCTATYAQAYHDAALLNIEYFFGQVVTSSEIMEAWPRQALRAAS